MQLNSKRLIKKKPTTFIIIQSYNRRKFWPRNDSKINLEFCKTRCDGSRETSWRRRTKKRSNENVRRGLQIALIIPMRLLAACNVRIGWKKPTRKKNDGDRDARHPRNPIKDDKGNYEVSGVVGKLRLLCHRVILCNKPRNFLASPLFGFAGRWTEPEEAQAYCLREFLTIYYTIEGFARKKWGQRACLRSWLRCFVKRFQDNEWNEILRNDDDLRESKAWTEIAHIFFEKYYLRVEVARRQRDAFNDAKKREKC